MKYSFIVLFCIVTACNTLNNGSDTDSNDTKTENYRVITFSDEEVPNRIFLRGRKFSFEEIFQPENILYLDDGLLIIGDRYEKSMIHLIDIGSHRYVRKYGKFGEGPGEIVSVSDLLPGHAPGSFWVYSARGKQLSEFNVRDTSALAVHQIRQEGDFFLAAEMAWSSDSTVMTTRTDGNEKLVEFSLDGKVINTYGSWRGMIGNEKTPSSIISSLHQGNLVSSRDKSVFLKTCVQRDLLEIFNKKTNETISIRGPENKMPKFTIDYSAGYPMPVVGKNFQLFYGNGFLGREFAYCLYSGQFTETLAKLGDYNKKIYVFNLQGIIQAVLELDHSLYNFTIDEEHKRIYGVTYDRDPNIVEFDLPKIN
jgi:TolB-like 6-blade propeller-like